MEPRLRLNELAMGYQHATVLLTACRIGLFEVMQDSAHPARHLAEKLMVEPRGLETLMLALAADGVLVQESLGAFRIHPDYLPLLLESSPQTQIHILNHQYNCLQRWVTLETRLRTGKPAPRETAAGADWSLRNFILGMADISRLSTEEVARRIDLSGRRRLLDIGGGPATSSIVLARHFPELQCTVLDLQEALPIAEEQIEKADMRQRIHTQVCDYMRDDFGHGYDVAYLSNIIHSLGPEDVRMVFEKTRRALDDGGMVIVKDFFLEYERTEPNYAAFFSINMLVATENGRSYTWRETENLLEATGFRNFRREPIATASGLVIGETA